MTDELDTAIATMTPEQMQELNVCLQQLAKELIPRLSKDLRKEYKQGLDEIRADSRLGDSQIELRRKALALDTLTRIVSRTSRRFADADLYAQYACAKPNRTCRAAQGRHGVRGRRESAPAGSAACNASLRSP
jgi:hypothetical protein